MFPPFGYSIQEFFIFYFYCQKTAFECEFQHTPCRKYCFWQPSTTLVNMRFCTHVPNSNKNKNMKSGTRIYVQKWFFWPPKHCCPSRAQWKKTFCLTLNVMISQTVRNECIRFGGHVDIEVSYKILLKKSSILDTSPCF
jgi:hypothetical protein